MLNEMNEIDLIRCEAKKMKVDPFKYEGIDLEYVWYGQCVVYSNKKRLYSHRSPMRRISRHHALTDAQRFSDNFILTNFVMGS